MGSLLCCKFFWKNETPPNKDIKKEVDDPIKRKIEFNEISLTN